MAMEHDDRSTRISRTLGLGYHGTFLFLAVGREFFPLFCFFREDMETKVLKSFSVLFPHFSAWFAFHRQDLDTQGLDSVRSKEGTLVRFVRINIWILLWGRFMPYIAISQTQALIGLNFILLYPTDTPHIRRF